MQRDHWQNLDLDSSVIGCYDSQKPLNLLFNSHFIQDFQLPDQLKVLDPSIKIFSSLDRVKEHSLSVCVSRA